MAEKFIFPQLEHQQLIKYAEDLSKLHKELKKENLRLAKANRELEKVTKELERGFYDSVLMGFDLITLYDETLGGHCKRVDYYANLLAEAVGLDESARLRIRMSALLHDIELVSLPRNIILKLRTNQEYSEEAWALYLQHPILKIHTLTNAERFKDIVRIVAAHHERDDGSGFPKGLQKHEIPLESKIIGLVDTYDIIRQSGKVILTPAQVFWKLEAEIGIKFDLELSNKFQEEILKSEPFSNVIQITLEEIRSGLIIAEPITTINGIKLLSSEATLKPEYIERILEVAKHTKIKQPIKVYKRQIKP